MSIGDFFSKFIMNQKPCPPEYIKVANEHMRELLADVDDKKGDDGDGMFFMVDGKEHCNEEQALAVLLADEVLFCNERKTVFQWNEKDPIEIEPPTTVLFVMCNDLFYWGTADGERLPNDEIGRLYKMHVADKKWGASKWCCLRRNLRPQVPIVEDMKKEGAWDAELEALPAPAPS